MQNCKYHQLSESEVERESLKSLRRRKIFKNINDCFTSQRLPTICTATATSPKIHRKYLKTCKVSVPD